MEERKKKRVVQKVPAFTGSTKGKEMEFTVAEHHNIIGKGGVKYRGGSKVMLNEALAKHFAKLGALELEVTSFDAAVELKEKDDEIARLKSKTGEASVPAGDAEGDTEEAVDDDTTDAGGGKSGGGHAPSDADEAKGKPVSRRRGSTL